jgi:hypothetical protein
VWGVTDRRSSIVACRRYRSRRRTALRSRWRSSLAARQIYAWHGNFYALELTERLGLEERGGLLRLGRCITTRPGGGPLLQALDELLNRSRRGRRLVDVQGFFGGNGFVPGPNDWI